MVEGIRLRQQPAGLFGGKGVAVLLAERDRRAKLGSRVGAPAGFQHEPADLQMRPPVHPLPSLESQGFPQILLCFGRAAQRGPCRAPLVVPERLFARHARTVVGRESREALVEEPFGLRGPSSADQGCARFEPQETVARVLTAQRGELSKRLVVSSLTVVKKNERDRRIPSIVAAVFGSRF